MDNIIVNNCSCLSMGLGYQNTYYYIESTCINSTYGSFYEYTDSSCTQSSGNIYSGSNGFSIKNFGNSTTQYILDCTNNRKCQIKNSSANLSISYFIFIINFLIYIIINM
jgi:hypothetical protein